jgi:hypothetical protein
MYRSASNGSELVNYSQDIGQNLVLIDAAVGFQAVTSSTRPGSPYSGKPIFQTDTSYSTYFSNGTTPASASWVEIPNSSSTFGGNLTIASGKQINLGGSTSGAPLAIFTTSTGSNIISSRITGDTSNSRWFVNADGNMNWGAGGGSATDTNLYRSAANTLKTDDVFSALVETTTSGATAGTNWAVTSFAGRRTCGVATVSLVVTYSGATITGGSSGNINDVLAVTLPSGWRPAATIVEAFDKTGTATGDVVIGSDGTCTLKTLMPTATIASGDAVTFSATYVL